MPPLWILPLFFLSGVSGLVYEVIWIRQFGRVFGNTVPSASLVTAIFMCGLGVGSYFAGGFADRRARSGGGPSLLASYGLAELGIAACGVLLALGLPGLESISAALSSYRVDDRGWHVLSLGSYAARGALGALLLLPPTLLMGATLTLLIRALVAPDVRLAGLRVGLLYGVNTAGAALGSLLTDLSWIPRLGVFGTQGLAAALNVAAGVGALVLARTFGRSVSGPAPLPEPAPPAGVRPPASLRRVGLALSLAGFVGMSLELVWFRFLISALGGQRAVFSMLLAVVLVGIWFGSLAGGALDRRTGRPAELFVLAEALLIAVSMAILLAYDRSLADHAALAADLATASASVRPWLEHAFNLRVIATVVGVPSFLMGCTFPLANACVQRAEASVGRSAGALYLANTLGAVLGSLLTGFVLLPAFGIGGVMLVLGALSAAASLACAAAVSPAERSVRRAASIAAFAGLGLIAVLAGVWKHQEPEALVKKTLPVIHGAIEANPYIVIKEGVNETIAIAQLQRGRALFTNGHQMSAASIGSQRYMRAFAHLPLLTMTAPETVLVICFGVGNTLSAAALHRSVKSLELADISEEILSLSDVFSQTNRGVIHDPRVSVFVNDGRQHLRMRPEASYDLITLEPPPPPHAGVSGLYSSEFYALAKSRLKPGGMLTQWLPAYQLPADVERSVVRAFLDQFPNAILLSGNRGELILMGSTAEHFTIEPAEVARRIEAEPTLKAELEQIALATPLEIVGTFAGGPKTLRAATRTAPPVTDDVPIMDDALIAISDNEVPSEFFDRSEVGAWCPSCAADPEIVPGLSKYLDLSARYYRSPGFRRWKSFGGLVDPKIVDADCSEPEVRETAQRSKYLAQILSCDVR
jgi:spermidine synthase